MAAGKRKPRAVTAWAAFNGNGEIAWQWGFVRDNGQPNPNMVGWSDTFGTYHWGRVRITPLRNTGGAQRKGK